MIEIEKKFILTDTQKEALIECAEFLGQKIFTDIYYDDKDFSLTSNDVWLRERGGKFELKLPMNESIDKRISDQYKEIDIDSDILAHFKAENLSMEDFLIGSRYKPFCSITTTRKKYKKEGFGIDMDSMDFGYTLAEIECMIDNESKIQEATQSVIKFADRHNIDTNAIIRGKVVEYLRINIPVHFQALVDAKVIRS